ncbi:class I SAM-dependent methyltransferase [Bordetella bronchiseptica]|uniref:methyltransferase domain-containing protein n=1 Tax=Bordetella bronchiseptica TaxID=518 RepID=UPI000F68EE9F|nr:class I SAM-dependent methyltransferase [Bordetella bronchiseptica]RSB97804.1 class I SAM-dependent methyltransferase [Bordetella bronchiseptica]RSC06858.1 class I SAM-dependent methyltransferase [Bordetella bronchiseptica]
MRTLVAPTHAPKRRMLLALLATPALALAQPAWTKQPPPVKLDVPYVPTPDDAVARMLEMADVTAQDTVIDLGSGDGRIAIAAVRDRGARSATGVDIDPERIAEARANAKKAGLADRVTFVQQDLFDTDISKATVLTMYLLPDVNLKLRPRILNSLAPGTRVVSHAFTMGEWDSDRYELVDGRSLYLWVVPAHAAGDWQVEDPAGPFTLSVRQDFQKVTASAQRQGERLGVAEAALRGTDLRFTVDAGSGPRTYVGRIQGDRMTAVQAPGNESGWRATRRAP